VESKSEWPRFAGDSKKFHAWYLSIMAQLSILLWQEMYNPTTIAIIDTTTNVSLNGKLYAKLLVCLEGQALQDIISPPHPHANGILLLQELVQPYSPKNVPEIIAAKTGEFQSHAKQLPTESIDHYYNRFHKLLEDVREADDPISTKSAMHHFIFMLGRNLNLYRIFTVSITFQ
jgi:hypothetical protein